MRAWGRWGHIVVHSRRRDGEAPLVEHAILSIGSGASHVSTAYDYLAKAEQSGCTDESVLQFLKLGSFGKHTQNMERDLMRRYLRGSGVEAEPYDITLNLHMPDERTERLSNIVASLLLYRFQDLQVRQGGWVHKE